MKHFINLKDIPAKDLRKIIIDAKKRKSLRKKLSTLEVDKGCLLYTSPSPRDISGSRMPSSA